MNLVSTLLPRKIVTLVTSTISALSLCALLSTQAIAASANIIPSSSLKKLDKSKPATKIEIITAVKKVYTGRILSVRKKYKARGNDCHHVKIIETQSGELLLIRVACDI